MRVTVSLCALMVEISNNLKFLPLIMLVLLISKAVGDTFNDVLYEEQARSMLYAAIKTEIPSSVVSLPLVIKVSDAVSILKCNRHNGFPVR
ncbi:chloride channel protein CLC-d-like [Chenopodium quinoa]|uniref:chloride channel protein CLC-d-like n=1 Tax=Chenopodium quinoa TaxID=63459 RepID=UPI000B791B7F|nr:chloride channel protein CLC-d-like [Chenopodium quinoa]XP_021730943.1 chloride channel protein CLC-d-like [Chenopodium quinoa]XP_021730944.1 chloride channel protein CLC-d-like [Chenopodium quinoa]XP_021730945.1 chloride channel protein CLC-d-like [Chenopodium quinoa]